MKEFFKILFSFNMKKIFIEPTKNSLLQFFRYGFVGAVATLVDWGVYYFVNLHIPYYISAVVAFVSGLVTNFLLSKKFVFSGEENKKSVSTEFFVYAIIGIIGLLITEAIMFVLIDMFLWNEMTPKVVATLVVFVWNFLARKVILYR